MAATGKIVVKTTLCLGILSGLKKRFSEVGFIKPVGQQHVNIEGINVDKDAVLFKDYFHLHTPLSDMSPVIIPAGFTKTFLDEEITEDSLQKKILDSFQRVRDEHPFTLVEGTGHVGVGSILNLNNAKVAALLGLDMVIVASGGLGSAHDELALNMTMCKEYGVKVRGVILNRVLEDKREMIMEYFPKSLKKWGTALLGCIPYNEFLNTPCMKDFETLFNATLISGEQHRYRHFQHARLVAGSLKSYQEEMIPNELVITPASREDIIMGTLQKHLETSEIDDYDYRGGMILTSRLPPSVEILEQIKRVDIPILYAPVCSYDAMKMITSFIAKIRKGDLKKIEKAINVVEGNVNFDLLCGN